MTLPHIQSLQPDLFGRITVMDEGKERTFVKDKLVKFLERAVKAERVNETSEELFFEEDDKPEPKKKGAAHRSKPIVAIKDGKEIPFKSSAEAARELKIDRTNIPHALSGKYRHVNGYQFKYA